MRISFTCLIALLLGVSVAGALDVGEPFPALELPRLDGGTGSINDYRGQKLALHVFASW